MSSEAFVGLIIAMFAMFLTGVGLRHAIGNDEADVMKTQAIERGYALYCPRDGKFAWKGECDDE